jgi:hypothetical protein
LERALSRAPGEIGRRPKEHAALLLDAAFNCEQFGDAAVASLIVRIGDMAGTAVGIDDTPRMRPVAEQGTTLIVFGAPLPRARLRPSVLGEAVHRLVASGRSVDLYARAPLSRDDARLWLSHPSLRAVRLVPDSAFTPSDLREWLGAGAKTFEVVHAVGPLSADLMPVASESGHQIVYESSGLNTRHYAREFEVALRASDTLALGRISLEFLRTWSSEDLAIRHADVVLVPDQETASFVSAVYGPGLEPICSGLATGGSSPNAGEPAPDLGAYVQRLISAYGASRVRDLPAAR